MGSKKGFDTVEGAQGGLVVISATRLSEKEFWKESALGCSLRRLQVLDDRVSYSIAFSNTRDLPSIYNAAIERFSDDLVLVFIHDDVWVEQDDFVDAVNAGLREYDVLGVAGNRRLLPRQPSWAFIDENFTWDDSRFLSGRVGHGNEAGGSETVYGEVPASCELLDGVLLAASNKALLRSGVRFDPQFDFHFYDLDFCRVASANGLKMGTWPLRITHQSGGAFGSDAWREKYARYLDKYLEKDNEVAATTGENLFSMEVATSPAASFDWGSAIAGGAVEDPAYGLFSFEAPSAEDPLLARALSVSSDTGIDLGVVAKGLVASEADSGKASAPKSKRLADLARSLLERLERQRRGESAKLQKLRQDQLAAVKGLLQEVLSEGYDQAEVAELQARVENAELSDRYSDWTKKHALREVDGQLFAERMMYQWGHRPVFHFVLFLFPGDEPLLGDTLDSLSEQLYQDWRLTVVADAPVPDALWEELEVLRWLQCGDDDDPYQLVNEAVAAVDSDWVAFIEPGTRWRQHTLLRVADYANLNADARFIYTDTDTVDQAGERSDPRFVPDVNPDMLRSMPYCRQGAWVRRDILIEGGGFEPLPGCEMHDQALKVLEQGDEQALVHIADVLVHTPSGRRDPDDATLRLTVKNHLERSGIPAVVGEGYKPGTLRVNYVHAEEAAVSLIIPNLDKFEYIDACVCSLFDRTAYDNFEVIIADRGSTDPDTLALYDRFDATSDGRISVLRFGADVSVAEACNRAAMLARGEYLTFLKNHVEARQSQWLTRLMLHAQRPEVGVVGPRVVFAESTLLFEAGIVLGMDDVAGKPFVNRLTLHGAGYMGRAQIDQNYSAVSDTCMTVRKSLFTELGGFDAGTFGKDFFDVDFCLRVGEAGSRVVWTPFSMLMAYKGTATINERGKSRGYLENVIAYDEARAAMLDRWLPKLARDPAYNPNLKLSSDEAFLVDDTLPLNWDVNFHERTRVMGLPLNGGSGEYRVIHPFDAISHAALQQTEYCRLEKGTGVSLKLPVIARMDPDVLLVQAGIDDLQVGLLQDLDDYRPETFKVFSLDDLITEIPEKSSVYKRHQGLFRNARARLRKALSLSDRMIVTTRPLADAYADMIDDIRVIPNRLQGDVWLPLESKRRVSGKPRVGWVGAQQHGGDLEIIIDVVKQTADKLDWVFMGMCPQELRPLVKEYHLDWVSYDQYPQKMASLNLDIAVAPLEIHRFNEAKSNLRLLEYGVLGWPVVCTDITPYQAYDAPVRRVPNDVAAWVEAIMGYANNLDAAAADGDRLRKWVKRHFILEDHLDEWVRALTPVKSRVPVVQGRHVSKAG